jgi:predicted GNAT superfamily acetyltransferase
MTKPRIRGLTRLREFDDCVVIQKRVWHHSATDLTPSHQFCVAVETGSILLGAFIGKEMAGFVYSFPSISRGRLAQHSHLLAVLPEHQGRGLGKLLKWAQHDEALRRGYDLMTWTYDPLRVRNANLNLHALGAEARTYLPNFYGRVPSLVFARDTDTDRLKVEWALGSARVAARRRSRFPAYDPGRETKLLEGVPRTGRLAPRAAGSFPGGRRLLLEIPCRLRAFRGEPGYVRAWQAALRRELTTAFARGYRLTDFILGERCYYVLEMSAPRKRKRP